MLSNLFHVMYVQAPLSLKAARFEFRPRCSLESCETLSLTFACSHVHSPPMPSQPAQPRVAARPAGAGHDFAAPSFHRTSVLRSNRSRLLGLFILQIGNRNANRHVDMASFILSEQYKSLRAAKSNPKSGKSALLLRLIWSRQSFFAIRLESHTKCGLSSFFISEVAPVESGLPTICYSAPSLLLPLALDIPSLHSRQRAIAMRTELASHLPVI